MKSSRSNVKLETLEKRKKSRKNLLSILIIMLIAFVMISPQIYQKYIVLGYDISFHFNRFYDLYRQIETGNFNYFQSIYGFNSSGRIINALYGFDFAFLNGILLYVTKSWLKFQIITSYLSLITAGFSMYALSKKMNLTNKYATLSAILYMTTASVTYYMRYQSYTGWGAAFLPLIFIPAIRAVKNQKKPINSFYLALPVTILLNTHIMSAVIGVLAIIPFFLVSFINSKQKISWLKDAILAVVLTMLMSLNTLYSYYEVFSTNNILSPFVPNSIYLESLRLSFSDNSVQRYASIVFSCIFLFTIAFIFFEWKKQSMINRIIGLTGIFFLFISSPLIPWDTLAKKFEFISFIQFPSRFSVVAYILLSLSFFIIIEKLIKESAPKNKPIMFSCVIVLVSLSVISNHNIMIDNSEKWMKDPISMASNKSGLMVQTDDEIRDNFRSPDLAKALGTISKGTSDYLPIPKEMSSKQFYKEKTPYVMYKKEIINNDINLKKEVLSDGRLSFSWYQEETEMEVLPVIIYENSTVVFNDKTIQLNDIKKSNIGSLKVKANKGDNNVIVGYQSKINIKYILLIKLLTIIIVSCYFLFRLATYLKFN